MLDFSVHDRKRQNLTPISHRDINNAILDLLGTSMAPSTPPFGITVSVPSNLMIPCATSGKPKRSTKRSYESLTPVEQYEYLIRIYLPRVITPFVDRGVIVPELTKKGNIHVHLICWDPDVRDKLDMITLQKTIGSTVLVYRITQGRASARVVLNYIHFLEDSDEWIKYMQKSQHEFEGKKELDVYTFNGPVMDPNLSCG